MTAAGPTVTDATGSAGVLRIVNGGWEGALLVVYDSYVNRHRPMTIQQVLQFKAAEKAAKDAFWAAAGAAGSKMTAKQVKLQAAMVAATKARQAAMTAYAAAL